MTWPSGMTSPRKIKSLLKKEKERCQESEETFFLQWNSRKRGSLVIAGVDFSPLPQILNFSLMQFWVGELEIWGGEEGKRGGEEEERNNREMHQEKSIKLLQTTQTLQNHLLRHTWVEWSFVKVTASLLFMQSRAVSLICSPPGWIQITGLLTDWTWTHLWRWGEWHQEVITHALLPTHIPHRLHTPNFGGRNSPWISCPSRRPLGQMTQLHTSNPAGKPSV